MGILCTVIHWIGSSDESVSVVDIAEGIDDIQLIELLDHALEVNQLSDIFDRVADRQHECMAHKALCREFAVGKNIVAETALSEMKRYKEADVSAVLQWHRVHIRTVEEADRIVDIVLKDQRSSHFRCISVDLVCHSIRWIDIQPVGYDLIPV